MLAAMRPLALSLALLPLLGLALGCNAILGTEAPILEGSTGSGGGDAGAACTDDGAWARWDVVSPPADRYTVESGSVTDALTHLTWQQEPTNTTSDVDFEHATSDCAELTLGGKKGWRLPRRMELVSIIDRTQLPISIDGSIFLDTQQAGYWTQTPFLGAKGGEWIVSFNGGQILSTGDQNVHTDLVRCVHDPDTRTLPCHGYDLSDDAFAVDTATKLSWQRIADSTKRDQTDAETFCMGLDLGSLHAGWTLPTIGELVTLVDAGHVDPALDPAAFPGEKGSYYWSSSISPAYADAAWDVDFTDGKTDSTYNANPEILVRCVHE